MILIDNSVYSFAFQIANGVPIIPFYDDQQDDELYHLMTYLYDVYQFEGEDIREVNIRSFKLEQLAEGQQEALGSEEDLGGNESEC